MQDQNTTIDCTFPVVVSLPCTITAATDPQTVDLACRAYYERAQTAMEARLDGFFSFPTLALFSEALVDGGAVTCLYEHDGERSARTLFPVAISLTAERRVVVRAFDTYRRAVRTFRVDRCAGAHLVVLPGELAVA